LIECCKELVGSNSKLEHHPNKTLSVASADEDQQPVMVLRKVSEFLY
jgi:hypothetical protein